MTEVLKDLIRFFIAHLPNNLNQKISPDIVLYTYNENFRLRFMSNIIITLTSIQFNYRNKLYNILFSDINEYQIVKPEIMLPQSKYLLLGLYLIDNPSQIDGILVLSLIDPIPSIDGDDYIFEIDMKNFDEVDFSTGHPLIVFQSNSNYIYLSMNNINGIIELNINTDYGDNFFSQVKDIYLPISELNY